MDNKKILVVEDEPELRGFLALELETSGYEVFLAADGEEGFHLARKVRPDLIISDVLMPKMDGNQLLKKLRGTDFGRRIPFFILTARGKMRDYFEAIEVDAFIEKPFEADDLLNKIEVALEQSTSQEEQGVKSENDFSGKKKILVLEDDPLGSEHLKSIFNDYGYSIKIVKSASKCLEEAVRFNPDMIISRYIFEGMDAGHLIRLLREMSHLKTIPILVYSNTMPGQERDNVLKSGATEFLYDASGIKLLKRANQIFNQ